MKCTLRYFQNTAGKAMKKLTFFGLLLKQPLENTGALISIQEHLEALQSAQESLIRAQEYSGALINTHNSTLPWCHEYSWVLLKSWARELMCAYEWSWVHLAPWRHAQETSWLMMAALALMAANELSWALIIIHECSEALMSSYEQIWAQMSMEPRCHKQSWAFNGTHEHSWEWCYEHS